MHGGAIRSSWQRLCVVLSAGQSSTSALLCKGTATRRHQAEGRARCAPASRLKGGSYSATMRSSVCSTALDETSVECSLCAAKPMRATSTSGSTAGSAHEGKTAHRGLASLRSTQVTRLTSAGPTAAAAAPKAPWSTHAFASCLGWLLVE